MTIEIVDFPIKQWWIFPVRYVSHYQAGYIQRGREMGSSSKQLDSHGWILLDSRTWRLWINTYENTMALGGWTSI